MPQINHRELWNGLGNITQKDWVHAGRRLNLLVLTEYGKGSHIAIKDPKYSNPADMTGLIATIQKRLSRIENQTIFKHFLENSIPEDEIWRALNKLK